MLIAIPTEGSKVSPHFGHCENFTIYDTNTRKMRVVPSPPHKPGLLPLFLKEQGANLVIAGGMGASAQNLLAGVGIQVIVGASGKLEDVINSYEKGELKSSGDICSEHAHTGHCHS